jgi:hypothetical protein
VGLGARPGVTLHILQPSTPIFDPNPHQPLTYPCPTSFTYLPDISAPTRAPATPGGVRAKL